MPTEQPVTKCNKCGKRWVCSAAHAGKTAPCPACGAMMYIPQMPCQMPVEPVRPIVTAQRVYRPVFQWDPQKVGTLIGVFLFLAAIVAVGRISWVDAERKFKGVPDDRIEYVMLDSDRDYTPEIGTRNGWLEVERYEPEDRVTLEEYERVRAGMTVEEVQRVIGFRGEPTADSKLLGYHHEIWSWANEDGSNMNVQFLDGKSHTKAQFGLR